VPWHFGQVCWIEKKPCCMRTWPWPAAGRAGLRFGARLLGAAAVQVSQVHGRDADAGFGAARGFFQRDLEVVAQVGAAIDVGASAAAAAAAAEDVAEDVAEGIGEAAHALAPPGRRP
jgi:hypothetical protein